MALLRDFLRTFTFANQLTFLRLIAIPFFIIAVLSRRFGIALGLFIAAAVTDWLDGAIARFLRQTTALGQLLDPMADKLLLLAAFICLTVPDHPTLIPDYTAANHIPVQLTILTISRDSFIVLTAIIMYLQYGVTRFPPTVLGKITTGAEMVLIALYLLFNARGEVAEGLVWPVGITLALVVVSGLHYVWRCGFMVRDAQASRSSGPRPGP